MSDASTPFRPTGTRRSSQAFLVVASGDTGIHLAHRHQGEPPRAIAEQTQGGGGGGYALRRPVDADQHVHRPAAGNAGGDQPRPGLLVASCDQGQQQRDGTQHQAGQAQAKGPWPSRPITIASTSPMQANVASSSDKNRVNDTCLTYLRDPTDPSLRRSRG
jgi:hypothetical protein